MRDQGQIRLIGRFRETLPAAAGWRTEVPVGGAGDLRAWDVVVRVGSCAIGVDAETRLRDIQAIDRRVMLKFRDSALNRVVLLVADTRWNRAVLREARPASLANFPVAGPSALAAIRRGEDPGGNAVIVL